MNLKIEVRTDSVILEGYVNAVGRDSRLIPSGEGAYVEQVVPKTFERALRHEKNIELRHNHQRVIGSTKEGNLTLREDSIGLFARAVVTDPEIVAKAKNNELRGWSFGFYDNEEKKIKKSADGQRRRYLKDIDLEEVS
ncbi:MAG: HK97 family phage prohead protease, partial [Ruthenibacterium sp.]